MFLICLSLSAPLLWYFPSSTVKCVCSCARAMQKVGYYGPVSPDGQGDCDHYCVHMHKTAQILTQSKNSDKAIFHTEMPDCCLNLLFWPCRRMLP